MLMVLINSLIKKLIDEKIWNKNNFEILIINHIKFVVAPFKILYKVIFVWLDNRVCLEPLTTSLSCSFCSSEDSL